MTTLLCSLAIMMLLTPACLEQTDASLFRKPGISEMGVKADIFSANVEAFISSPEVIVECGVLYGKEPSYLTEVKASLSGNRLKCEIKGLEDNCTYLCRVFLSNGTSRIYSDITEFRTKVSPYIKIKDPEFSKYLLEHFDTNKDGGITPDEAKSVIEMEVHTENIVSIEGIENFTNLAIIRCIGGNYGGRWDEDKEEWIEHHRTGSLKSADLSHNTKLVEINIGDNPVNEIHLPHTATLTRIGIYQSDITSIELPAEAVYLQQLDLSDNNLSELDLTAYPLLEELGLNCNKLRKLDLSQNPLLKGIHLCSMSWLYDAAFFRNYPLLTSVNICGYDQAEIDFSLNTKLESIWFSDSRLETLDLRNSKNIRYLEGYHNPYLQTIYLPAGCHLETLHIGKNVEVVYL